MIIDFLFIAVFLFSCFFGYRKGFSKIFFNFFAIILSLVISICLYSPLSDMISKTSYGAHFNDFLYEKVEQQIYAENESEIPSIFITGIQQTKENITEYVSKKIVKIIISLVCALILFIVSKIIILILKKFIFKITELPGVNIADSSLGLILGAINGLILTMVIYILSEFAKYISDSQFIKHQCSQSVILLLISDYFII